MSAQNIKILAFCVDGEAIHLKQLNLATLTHACSPVTIMIQIRRDVRANVHILSHLCVTSKIFTVLEITIAIPNTWYLHRPVAAQSMSGWLGGWQYRLLHYSDLLPLSISPNYRQLSPVIQRDHNAQQTHKYNQYHDPVCLSSQRFLLPDVIQGILIYLSYKTGEESTMCP
jgi:hypothetical protein